MIGNHLPDYFRPSSNLVIQKVVRGYIIWRETNNFGPCLLTLNPRTYQEVITQPELV